MKSSLLLLAAVFVAASPLRADATQSLPHPGLAEILASLGDTTIPPAWAGIWHFDNTDFDCSTNDPIGFDSADDTLCTGAEVYPGGGLVTFTCTGTTNDTSINITCTGSGGFPPICTVDATVMLVATLSGQDLNATFTTTVVSTPPNCYGQDGCVRTETIGTYLGPEPAECASPVEPGSWGRLKSRYR
jgi:hypothetical protein